MPARQIASRHDSRWTQMRYDQFKLHKFKPSELRELTVRYKRAMKAYANLFHIISMPVRSADINTIRAALDDLRDDYGFTADLLLFDSADHLRSADSTLDQFRLQQADVYWELKAMAEDDGYVVWTTTHAGREWAAKVVTAEGAAEAYDKSRIADTIFTINDPFASARRKRIELSMDEDEEDEEPEVEGPAAEETATRRLELFLAKYRDGLSKIKIEVDADFSRMSMAEVKSKDDDDDVED
jgi:hypothetical protein